MLRHPGLIPLSHEHQHALALCVLTERALAADSSAEAVKRAVAGIVRAFDSEIRDHFEFEERVLFPMVEHDQTLASVVPELKKEHVHIAGLLAALKRYPEKVPVMEFCCTLRDHVRKEESVLFQGAQEVLSADQLSEIGQKRVVKG
jgi:hemerythrin-like domain-containing protein